MEVILIDDVEGLGKKGVTVKVKNGYARNFLVPRKLAIPSGNKTAKMYLSLAKQNDIAKDKSKKAAEAAAAKYAGVTLEATARALASTLTPAYLAAAASAAFRDLSFAMSFCFASVWNTRADF